ncbi:MAG: GHKL domain-containing protein [Lachnospiraceae bacterium]|nr:GHKL domain-containing protein [Lachnospiraceae bacterium]
MMEQGMKLLPDIPRFYTALAEWAACMVFICVLKRQMTGWKLAVISGTMLLIQSGFLVFTADIGLGMWLPCMVIAVLSMIVFLGICLKGSWCDAVYCGLFSFVIAEFAASLEWQLYLFFFRGNITKVVSYLVMLTAYGVIYIIIWWLLKRQRTPDGMLYMKAGELSAVLLIAISVFAMSNLGFLQISTPFSSQYKDAVSIIRTMIDFAGVAMMYAFHVLRNENRARLELDMMQDVLKNQYLQYQHSKESIDLINYKYHDLKHQIAVLRAEQDQERRNAFLNQMEEEIHQYEAQNKTGNQVVDTILTGKNVICEQFGISMNCVADGMLLDFMDTMDICSILGNALDNAIECEKQIPDPEKRLIHVAIFGQKNFVILRFENYFDGQLEIKEGIPVTTKTKKKEFHGFGIRSIKYAVDKYDGAVSISQNENWFELKILIPMKK